MATFTVPLKTKHENVYPDETIATGQGGKAYKG